MAWKLDPSLKIGMLVDVVVSSMPLQIPTLLFQPALDFMSVRFHILARN